MNGSGTVLGIRLFCLALLAELAGSETVFFEEHAVEGLTASETNAQSNFFSRVIRFGAEHTLGVGKAKGIEQVTEIVICVELNHGGNIARVGVQ